MGEGIHQRRDVCNYGYARGRAPPPHDTSEITVPWSNRLFPTGNSHPSRGKDEEGATVHLGSIFNVELSQRFSTFPGGATERSRGIFGEILKSVAKRALISARFSGEKKFAHPRNWIFKARWPFGVGFHFAVALRRCV